MNDYSHYTILVYFNKAVYSLESANVIDREYNSIDWQLKNWGTEGNAFGTKVIWDSQQIIFQTAWDVPRPIAAVLYELFPDIEFEWRYAGLECGINAGIITNKNKELASRSFEDLSEEAYKAYWDCWEHCCVY